MQEWPPGGDFGGANDVAVEGRCQDGRRKGDEFQQLGGLRQSRRVEISTELQQNVMSMRAYLAGESISF